MSFYKDFDFDAALQDVVDAWEETSIFPSSVRGQESDSTFTHGTSHGGHSTSTNYDEVSDDEDLDEDELLLRNHKKFNIIPMPAIEILGASSSPPDMDPVEILYRRPLHESTVVDDYDDDEKEFNNCPEYDPDRQGSSESARNLHPTNHHYPAAPETSPPIVVTPLNECPENIRWMYKYENDKIWVPFYGYDSNQLESRYQVIKDTLKYPLGVKNMVDFSNYNPEPIPTATSSTAIISTLESTNPISSTSSKSSTIMTEFLNNSERRFSLVNKTIFAYSEKAKRTSGSGTGATRATSIADFNNSFNNLPKKWFNPWTNSDCSSVAGSGTTDQNPNVAADDEDLAKLTVETDKDFLVVPTNNIVIVKSGLYEADLSTWQCTSTFWPGDVCEITRGSWFQEGMWEPILMVHAEQLEQEHLDKFAEAPLTSSVFPLFHSLPESPTRKIKTVAHRVTFPEYHIDWTSPTDIHLYRKRSSSIFMKSVSQKLGFQWGERISRGYFKPANLQDKPPEIGHVVFVVHGIGQKMDTGRIARNCATFRDNVNAIQRKYFNDEGGNDKIAEFFPIEWRSSLRLDGDVVDSITPNKILGLRQLLNSTAMDIMYYTSPLYRREIQSALRDELNRTYKNFIKRNPDFEINGGKFSILAHSLGAVITYDIITSPLLEQPDDWPEGRIEDRAKVRADKINGEQVIVIEGISKGSHQSNCLQFHLEHFFSLGSPLSVFLALRWREPHNPVLRPYILPDRLCRRMYNVFNLNDPVAYRLEPLLNKNYINIPPVAIINHNAPPHTKYDEMIREIVNKDLVPPEYSDYAAVENQHPYYHNIEASEQQFYENMGSSNSNYLADSMSDYQLRSPPPQTAAITDSFFAAIYNYWNHKQPIYLPYEPNEMEVAAAKLDSLNFNVTSLDEDLPVSVSDVQHDSFIGSVHDCYAPEPAAAAGFQSESGAVGHVGFGPASAFSQNSPQQPIPHDLDYRIDYVMRENNLPIPTGYLAALTSHTSYWSSPDIGFFVLSHLYNRIPNERKDGYSSPQ